MAKIIEKIKKVEKKVVDKVKGAASKVKGAVKTKTAQAYNHGAPEMTPKQTRDFIAKNGVMGGVMYDDEGTKYTKQGSSFVSSKSEYSKFPEDMYKMGYDDASIKKFFDEHPGYEQNIKSNSIKSQENKARHERNINERAAGRLEAKATVKPKVLAFSQKKFDSVKEKVFNPSSKKSKTVAFSQKKFDAAKKKVFKA